MDAFKHPRTLPIYFATEMWERYGFYVVQTLLALYLALYFKWPDQKIYALVGSFTALTYISPVIGGWIADHLLGQKRCTLIGGVFLLISYLLLSNYAQDQSLIFALSGIAVGTGLLKSNISSLLGNEYPEESPLRESGFTIFYMGITTGIIFGTTFPSILNAHFGWSASFASAAFGIVLAIFIFAFGIRQFKIQDYQPYHFNLKNILHAVALISLMWIAAFYILSSPALANSAFITTTLVSFGYILYCAYKEEKTQAMKTLSIGILCIISIVFWAFYFQMFLSFTLFISRVVCPKLLGLVFPAPYFVAIQSLGMILIGILISRHQQQKTTLCSGDHAGTKFIIAMGLSVSAYLLLFLAAQISLKANVLLISPIYIIPVYLFYSGAELMLSPVGLCAVTVLASRKRVSTMMGIFFVSLGIGGFLAGKLALFTAVANPDTISLIDLKNLYAVGFAKLLACILIAFLMSLGLNQVIKNKFNK